MRRPVTMMILAVLASAAGPAVAQESDRYTLERTDNGFVRLDRRSGEVSTCTGEGTGMVCRMAPDERRAYHEEVERLQKSVDALSERVQKLEGSLSARLEQALPTEQQFDQTLTYMERFLRRFMDVVKDIDKPDPPPAPAPDRT
jgi:cell division protein FtsB